MRPIIAHTRCAPYRPVPAFHPPPPSFVADAGTGGKIQLESRVPLTFVAGTGTGDGIREKQGRIPHAVADAGTNGGGQRGWAGVGGGGLGQLVQQAADHRNDGTWESAGTASGLEVEGGVPHTSIGSLGIQN